MNLTNSKTTIAEIDGGEGATGSVAKALKKRRADANLREMLSTLVHEANFLVEDNLNDLVGDIPENERVLFKLDSILTAIGNTRYTRRHEEKRSCFTYTLCTIKWLQEGFLTLPGYT